MVTLEVDLNADIFPDSLLVDGMDVTSLPRAVVNGIAPDKLIVVTAFGPGGGNPVCHATFNDEKKAHRWFAVVADDSDPDWFEENVIARV